MLPTLSQVCSLPSPFEKDLEDYAAGHCPAIELWLPKLEKFLETHTADVVKRLLATHELQPAAASFQGGLLITQGEPRRAAWALFKSRLEICRQIGVPVLVVAGDITGALIQTDIDRVRVSLVEAARAAEEAGVSIALEFQGRASLANNLPTAAALVAEVGSPRLGLCFDLFHFYIGPSKHEDLGALTRENLLHVQLCDLADVPRELAADGDRILPGDGDFYIEPLLARLREIGYDRAVSIETLNPLLWQIPPRQFGEVAITALRRLLGQASMG